MGSPVLILEIEHSVESCDQLRACCGVSKLLYYSCTLARLRIADVIEARLSSKIRVSWELLATDLGVVQFGHAG